MKKRIATILMFVVTIGLVGCVMLSHVGWWDEEPALRLTAAELNALIQSVFESQSARVGFVWSPGFEAIHVAALLGRSDWVSAAIDSGVPVSQATSYGITALHLAANAQVARVLIEEGADVEARLSDGRTVLHCVRKPDVAHFLIESGVPVESRDSYGRTPLFCTSDPAVAEVLIREGAAVDSVDMAGNTPLLCAARNGDAEMAEFLLQKGADALHLNHDGWSALICVAAGSTVVWEVSSSTLVREEGAGVGKADLTTVPLAREVRRDHLRTARLLLANGLDPNFHTRIGESALLESVQGRGNPDMVRFLLAAGAEADAICLGSSTPLSETENMEIAQILIAAGADPNFDAGDGKTPLHWAAFRDAGEVVEVLMQHGARVKLPTTAMFLGDFELARSLARALSPADISGNKGIEALARAVSMENVDMVRFLLDIGVPAQPRCRVFLPPLHAAVFAGNEELVRLLLKEGANPNARDDCGRSALDIARHRDASGILTILEESTNSSKPE